MKTTKLKAIKVTAVLLAIATAQALSSCAGWNGFWGIDSGVPGMNIGIGGSGPIGGPPGAPPPPPGGPW